MELQVGSIVEGKVTTITKFGAFVDLGEGKTGMVHISEVAPTYVKEITDHVNKDQVVRVKVISISPEGKIALSIKKAMDQPQGVLCRHGNSLFRDVDGVLTVLDLDRLGFPDKKHVLIGRGQHKRGHLVVKALPHLAENLFTKRLSAVCEGMGRNGKRTFFSNKTLW